MQPDQFLYPRDKLVDSLAGEIQCFIVHYAVIEVYVAKLRALKPVSQGRLVVLLSQTTDCVSHIATTSVRPNALLGGCDDDLGGSPSELL